MKLICFNFQYLYEFFLKNLSLSILFVRLVYLFAGMVVHFLIAMYYYNYVQLNML